MTYDEARFQCLGRQLLRINKVTGGNLYSLTASTVREALHLVCAYNSLLSSNMSAVDQLKQQNAALQCELAEAKKDVC